MVATNLQLAITHAHHRSYLRLTRPRHLSDDTWLHKHWTFGEVQDLGHSLASGITIPLGMNRTGEYGSGVLKKSAS